MTTPCGRQTLGGQMRAAVILFLTMSFSAAAYQDVSCWDADCFKNGWTRKDESTGAFTDYQCYRDGCKVSGWIVGGTQNGERYYTQCKPGGCFNDGWYEIDRDSQILIATVSCQQRNCLKSGWVTYRGNWSLTTTCLAGDCERNGWLSQQPDKYIQATCKRGSCFTVGWIE